ncbi:unnamed protein product [Paramecium octaurelia]|uniref:SPRY domain-containing protein n=1 Tax=Paramecium octaurelia TaxID=43137 RepID=A0A8S1YP43_PAROT|nr:unnamed protein product [Paramecium octaurelia]
MELKKISDGYAEEIVNLKIQKQEIQENLNQNKSKTDSKIQILEQQLKELKEKIEEGERSKIENFQKFLQYSNIYKSNNCSISDGGKIAECGSNPGFCICEQMIPKFGITKFAFQVIEKSGWLFFGIGIREIIKQKGFGSNYRLNCGVYLIAHDGNVFSDHDSQIGGQRRSFQFGQNDSIIVEVNMDLKKIKWIKLQSNESCMIDVDTSKELYPCALLYPISKIRILNEIPK